MINQDYNLKVGSCTRKECLECGKTFISVGNSRYCYDCTLKRRVEKWKKKTEK